MKVLAITKDKLKRTYTSRLQKGGALLNDMRLLVRQWSDEASYNEQRQKIIIENTLGKKTRVRATDIFRRAFSQRFLKGDLSEAWKIVRPLEDSEVSLEILRPVYYWITCRSDDLLYDFVKDIILYRSKSSDFSIRVDETSRWIKNRLVESQQEWSETVTIKVARGLLATLRDFGLLEGRITKKISPPYLPCESFAYLAFVLHTLGNSGENLVTHPDWQLFLLSSSGAEHLLLEAHQRRFLRYAAAGRIHRIEFDAQTLEEMADVIVGRRI
jgi:hypothetical protein